MKQAAATVNALAGRLPLWKLAAIAKASEDLINGLLAEQFPLPVWQSGSGRDADTNVNEVLANRACQLLGSAVGKRDPIDPICDVNLGQNPDRTFTASMQIATVIEIEQILAVRGSALTRAFGRDNTMVSGHARRFRAALGRIDEAECSLHEIGAGASDGGTTSEMTEEDWCIFVDTVAAATGRPFITAAEGVSERGSLDAMVAAMAAIRGLAVVLSDIADAVYACRDTGQRPAIMALVEAVKMVCTHVVGQDQIVTAAACHGSRAPGMMRPLIIASVLNAINQLAEACDAVRRLVSQRR